MINLKEICCNIKKEIIVAPKDISQNIEKTSCIIANVLNEMFFPSLTKQPNQLVVVLQIFQPLSKCLFPTVLQPLGTNKTPLYLS